MSIYPEVAASLDPRTVVIEPQDLIYKAAQIAGTPDITLTSQLRQQVAGLYELAAALCRMEATSSGITYPAFPRLSSISTDLAIRPVGKSNTATPAQGTLTLLDGSNAQSADNVALNDGTGSRDFTFGTGGDVTVPVGSTTAQSCRNLVNSINVDREAGNSTMFAAYLGEDPFGITGHVVVILVGTPAEWDDNDTITTDITDAVATGFTLGVAP